jgi:hypothetical protein
MLRSERRELQAKPTASRGKQILRKILDCIVFTIRPSNCIKQEAKLIEQLQHNQTTLATQ